MSKCKAIRQTRPVYCESYTCNKRAAYSVGNTDGPLTLLTNYCKDCYKSLFNSMQELQMQEEPEFTEEPAVPEAGEAKIYTCDTCGEEFDVLQKYAAHRRFCKAGE